MTFKEYIRTPLLSFSSESARNPLAEVRWWGFLAGDAYANPFHDLLYVFSRSDAPAEKAPTVRSARTVTFSASALTVTGTDDRRRTYDYSSLAYLKIDYTCMSQGSMSEGMYFFTRLEFGTLEGKKRIELKMTGRGMLAICNLLLHNQVAFKEYYNGMRSFLQETNFSYDEIQVLKRKHGIEW